MKYAVQQDLIDRFGQQELIELTDRADPPAGAIDATVIDKALSDADNLVDSYVGKRYDLPLVTTPPVLVRTAADIARYYLYDDDRPDAVKDAYDDALKLLRDIAAGKAALPDVAGEAPKASTDGVAVAGPAKVFGRDKLGGF